VWLQLAEAHAEDPAPVVAPAGARARLDVYDDGWIHVKAPSASLAAVLRGGWKVDAGWSSDFVSGATPHFATDTISSATTFTEARHGGTLSAELAREPEWSLAASYGLSAENDYVVHTASVGGGHDVLGRMARLRGQYTARLGEAGRVDDPEFSAFQFGHTLDLNWNQVLGRTRRLGLFATGTAELCDATLGCEASPYRRILVDGVPLPERHPDRLQRMALAARLSQAVGSVVGLHGGVRLYADSWSVLGETGDLAVSASLLGDRLVLRATGRASHASPASFFRPDYAGPGDYLTADRELVGLTTVLAGGGAEWASYGLWRTRRVSMVGKLQRMWLDYDAASGVPDREAWVGGGGVDVAW
jgi:hypothetical protein